ncbi:MAG: hypothetical protein HDR02_12880 [Lachnospiraceae bacterium]|nr:hypothetical protein [Lachnospiraceae bacterium]
MKYKFSSCEKIAFHDIAVHENRAWFCNIGYNALFQMDILTGKLKLLDFFPDDNFERLELYAPIAYLDNKLYIGPRNGDHILIYDLEKSSFTTMDIDFEKYGEKNNYNIFSHVEVIHKKVYFFPGRFRAIVELDPVSQAISYIDNWYEELSEGFFEQEDKRIIFQNIHIDAAGNCILPCWKSQETVILNVCSREYEILRPMQKSNVSLSDAVEIEGNIIFSYKDERGVGDYKSKNLVALNDAELKYTQGLFLAAYKGWLYIVPMYGNAVVRCLSTTGTKEYIYRFPESISPAAEWIPYKNNSLFQKVIENNRLAIFSVFDEKFIIVEMETGQVQNLEICLDDEDKRKIQNYLYTFMSANTIYETECFDLKDFIAIIDTVKEQEDYCENT